MIVIRLGKPRTLTAGDPLGRCETGFRAGLSEDEYWERARGLWRLDERRVLKETYAVVTDSRHIILAVATITGVMKFERQRAIEGNVIKGHHLVGRKCPFKSGSRNSISYFDDLPTLAMASYAIDDEALTVDTSLIDRLQPPLKVISLFSGAGGLDAGFDDRERYELLACIELDHACCLTLECNKQAGMLGNPDTQIIEADLSKLDPGELMKRLDIKQGEIDLLIGGPPCQSWSTTGRRRTAQDARGMLIWHFLRFVEALQPQYFLMENVRGLLSAAFKHRPIAQRPTNGGPALLDEELPGSAIKIWLDDATSLLDGKYHVDYFEVNSVNYGAPEIRERVLFFGNRRNQRLCFPQPTHGPQSPDGKPYATLGQALEGLCEDPEKRVIIDFSERKKKYLSFVPEGGNWRAMPEDIQRESMGKAFFAKGGRSGWWRRLSWDLPSPTIVTMPNHASTALCHPTETRALSVAECSRIQEFPSNWFFVGTAQEQMRQVGNAVPVRLARVASEVLYEAALSEPSVNPQPERWNHEYIYSMVRTRQWYKAGKVFIHSKDGDIPQ